MMSNMDSPVLDILLDFLVPEVPSNETLEGKHGVLGVNDSLTLGWKTDETFAVLCETNNGWSSSGTLCVLNNAGFLAFHHGDTRVGGTQVNTDDRA